MVCHSKEKAQEHNLKPNLGTGMAKKLKKLWNHNAERLLQLMSVKLIDTVLAYFLQSPKSSLNNVITMIIPEQKNNKNFLTI